MDRNDSPYRYALAVRFDDFSFDSAKLMAYPGIDRIDDVLAPCVWKISTAEFLHETGLEGDAEAVHFAVDLVIAVYQTDWSGLGSRLENLRISFNFRSLNK